MKKDEIQKDVTGLTREKFLYNLSKAEYEKTWGHNYHEPGFGSRVLAWLIRIFPKVGPFAAVTFRTPTPETEKMFMDSFNRTVDRYKTLLAAEDLRGANPPDLNLDVGKPTTAGAYKISDETYARLVHSSRGVISKECPVPSAIRL
jgi:hypothetical protein